jgi:hypothetical protein
MMMIYILYMLVNIQKTMESPLSMEGFSWEKMEKPSVNG